MLRASARKTNRDFELAALIDGKTDSRLALGRELIAFTDAAVLGQSPEMTEARRNLMEAGGEAAVIRAAACAGNFEMMNRLLDAIGAPVGDGSVRLAEKLGLTVPDHLRP